MVVENDSPRVDEFLCPVGGGREVAEEHPFHGLQVLVGIRAVLQEGDGDTALTQHPECVLQQDGRHRPVGARIVGDDRSGVGELVAADHVPRDTPTFKRLRAIRYSANVPKPWGSVCRRPPT